MSRKLVAALACRANGKRLYAKPLQNLDDNYRIIDHLIQNIKSFSYIDDIVLGVSAGIENLVFHEIAKKYNISSIEGCEKDVLGRLVQCAHSASATDVFRVTSESPFIAWEYLEQAWDEHIRNNNDITVTDYLPEGMNFEIYKTLTLEKSHLFGGEEERSEFCSLYARRHREQFKIGIVMPEKNVRRMDLRVTVDNPEDLILAKNIYQALKFEKPFVPTLKVIDFIDKNKFLKDLVQKFVDDKPLWVDA